MAGKMMSRWVWFAALAAGCLVAAMVVRSLPPAPQPQETATAGRPLQPTPAGVPERSFQHPLAPDRAAAPQPVRRSAKPAASPIARTPGRDVKSVQVRQTPGGQTAGAPGGGKDPIANPEARLALSMVGVDPGAEEVWCSAINDPRLGADERKDLIEDLNEDGFSNPKNPTKDDLPLIVSRMQIIEDIAGNAMDEINAAAFAEAYKDLANMYARLAGQ